MDVIFWALQYVAMVVMIIYFVWAGISLLRGKDAAITGFTSLTEEDKKYYDLEKLRKTMGLCYCATAVSLLLMVVAGLMGIKPFMLLTIVAFFVSVGAPTYLIRKTSYFIKKR